MPIKKYTHDPISFSFQTTSHFVPSENRTVSFNRTVARAKTTPLRSDPLYSQITMIIMLVFSGVLPLCILIFLNTKIYVAIRTRNQRLTTMSSKQRR